VSHFSAWKIVRNFVFLFAVASAHAADFPQKAIRLIVPFPAGGTSDIVARIVSERASKSLGQLIIIDNRAGAGGNIGMEAAAKAAPDGYTLGYCSIGTCAMNVGVYREKLPYHPERDFAPVMLIGMLSNILVANNKLPAKNIAELIALAKSKPGGLTIASSGYGSSPHLCAELLKDFAGIDLTHVPYKGSAPAIADLQGGQIDLFFDNSPSILPFIKSGALRALAVTGSKRLPALPDVPTLKQAGFAEFIVEPWFGIIAPSKVPAPVLAKLNQAFADAAKDPAVIAKLRESEMDVVGGAPERLGALIHSEIEKWNQVARKHNIQLE
jgi:tripartite-type tricarboxylate transporter receptor subunit TctC